ncbi:MAG TPA: hypothetical protein VJU79_00915 [Candidatus Dormibacteraeota bacterium]|nr:hypothetical protein [Candidatus Dormibacteraeota bacterium]
MPKKTRRQKQRSAARRQGPVIPGGAGLDTSTVDTADQAQTDDAVALEMPVVPAPAPGNAPAATSPVAVTPAPASMAQPAPMGARRRVERLNTPAAPAATARPPRGTTSAVAMFEPLPPEEAAIPFDRVPYVPADLKRVAIMAVLMVVVIIIAAVVVSHIVT